MEESAPQPTAVDQQQGIRVTIFRVNSHVHEADDDAAGGPLASSPRVDVRLRMKALCRRAQNQLWEVFGWVVFHAHWCPWLFMCALIALVGFTMRWAEAQHEREASAQLGAQIERVHAELVALVVPRSAQVEARIRALEVELAQLVWANGRHGVPLPARAENASAATTTTETVVWTVPNSLLFATSLVARIGYGHMVPITALGKVLSQLFAIAGIPLFRLLLKKLNKCYDLCLRILLELPHTLRTCVKMTKAKVHQRGHDGHLRRAHWLLIALFLVATTALFRQLEGWRWLDSAYFVLSSSLGIGFGDFAPSTALSAWLTIGALFIGLAQVHIFLRLAEEVYKEMFYELIYFCMDEYRSTPSTRS